MFNVPSIHPPHCYWNDIMSCHCPTVGRGIHVQCMAVDCGLGFFWDAKWHKFGVIHGGDFTQDHPDNFKNYPRPSSLSPSRPTVSPGSTFDPCLLPLFPPLPAFLLIYLRFIFIKSSIRPIYLLLLPPPPLPEWCRSILSYTQLQAQSKPHTYRSVSAGYSTSAQYSQHGGL